MRSWQLFTFSGVISIGLTCTAMAQTVPPSGAFDLIDPGRELQDKLEQERREDEVRRFQSRKPAITPSIVNPEGENDGPCVVVNEIKIKGVTALRPGVLDKILTGRTPGCLRRYHISNLMRTLDKAYVDQGLITARTYIPKQNIQDTAILTLQVVEGKIESIKLFENETEKTNGLSQLRLFTAFPNKTGKDLNVRDFEQGLEQLNRLPSVQAKMRLEPGEKPGGSIVVIDTKVSDRIRGSISWDNLGSLTTGQREGRAQLSIDNLFFANDTASLVYVGSTNANALNAVFSVPLGYNSFTLSGSMSDYLIPLSDVSELFSETESYAVSIDRVLTRNTHSIWHLSGALRYRKNQRFINGFALSPQNTTISDIRVRQINNKEDARWSWEVGLRFGLPLFNGLTDDGTLPRDIAHPQFQALDFSISRFGKKQTHGRWATTFRGQLAEYALLGNEQLSIGSQSTVRGFDEPLLGVDAGVVLRHEGTFSLPILTSRGDKKARGPYDVLRQRSRIYLFTDIGWGYSFGTDQYQLASGVGGGLRYYAKRVQFDVGLQSGLVDHSSLGLKHGKTRLTASVTLKIL